MDQLPTFVKRAVARNYSDYTVKEVFKFQNDDAINYFVAAENEKENVVLQASGGLFSIYSRTAKNNKTSNIKKITPAMVGVICLVQ